MGKKRKSRISPGGCPSLQPSGIFLKEINMQIVLIEREMKDKEEALRRCRYNVACLKQANNKEYEKAIYELSQEVYMLEDQLEHYRVVFNLLREDQKVFDNVPKRI